MITDPVVYAVAVLCVISLGLSKGGFSGVGTIAAPLLSLVVPPVQALGILLPILLVQDVVTIWAYRHTWDRWNLAVLIPGQLIGTGIAWLLAFYVSDAYVRLVIGMIAIAFVLNHWFGRRPAEQPGRPPVAKGVFWGAIAGLTSFLANAAAPPFQVFVLPQRLAKEVFVGTLTIFLAFGNVLKIVALLHAGRARLEQSGDLGRAAAAGDRRQYGGGLAGAADADGDFLQSPLCADLPGRLRADPRRADGDFNALRPSSV